MSQIFIIAGPPGIGKTTIGHQFINPDFEILNEDEMRFKYRELGYPDYKEQAIHRVTQAIRSKLIRNEDFAFELNLGFPEHYDYVLSAKKFNADNKLNIILFYTDNVDLCLERARVRHESGRHLVKPETVREMYNNTIPLLKENFQQIDLLNLINVEINDFAAIAKYDKAENTLGIMENECKWFNEDLYSFIMQSDLAISRDDDLNLGLNR